MSYVHDNKKPVVLKNDPADENGTDWIYFSYQDWLRTGETISDHHAFVTGGIVATDSTYLGTMEDRAGVTFSDVYGVQFTVDAGATTVMVTHRVSTTTTGAVDLGRLNMDMSATLPVRVL